MLACLLLGAALARAEMVKPVSGGVVDAVPKRSLKARWEDLAALVEGVRRRETGFGPVAIYDIYEQARLPPRIYVLAAPSSRTLLEEILEGTLEPGWKASGRYWVLGKDEAVKKIAKAMRKKTPEEIAQVRASIEHELGPSLIMIYRVHKGAAPAAAPPAKHGEEGDSEPPVISPDAKPAVPSAP